MRQSERNRMTNGLDVSSDTREHFRANRNWGMCQALSPGCSAKVRDQKPVAASLGCSGRAMRLPIASPPPFQSQARPSRTRTVGAGKPQAQAQAQAIRLAGVPLPSTSLTSWPQAKRQEQHRGAPPKQTAPGDSGKRAPSLTSRRGRCASQPGDKASSPALGCRCAQSIPCNRLRFPLWWCALAEHGLLAERGALCICQRFCNALPSLAGRHILGSTRYLTTCPVMEFILCSSAQWLTRGGFNSEV